MGYQWIKKSGRRVFCARHAATGLIALIAACLLVSCNGRSSPTKAGGTSGGSSKTEPFVPPEELWELNNQGVGYMEQFDDGGGFSNAVPVFEEIVRRWPAWTPGKFNLAVAILNAHPEDQQLERAKTLLREVLAADDNDAHAHYALGFLLYYQGKFSEALPHLEKVCFE